MHDSKLKYFFPHLLALHHPSPDFVPDPPFFLAEIPLPTLHAGAQTPENKPELAGIPGCHKA